MEQLSVLLGGHVAEDMVFNERTTGPHDDIENVTRIARAMVTEYGMSDNLEPRTFGRKEELVFLGKEISEQRNYSEGVASEIDKEVRTIIERAHETAIQILSEEKDRLAWIARMLIAEESLDGEVLERLFTDPVPSPSEQKPESEREETPSLLEQKLESEPDKID